MFISASRMRGPAESADESSVWRMSEKSFTDRQGQYLAFIDAYTRVHGRPPAETDMQRHFQVSPPAVHQMVLTLERAGLIRRQPGGAPLRCSWLQSTCPSSATPSPSNPLGQGSSLRYGPAPGPI